MWKTIWNKEDRINKIILEMLFKADGFDSKTGSFEVDDWCNYTNELYEKLQIDKKDSIFDVGCGSGAFLYQLYLKNHTVGGNDYSIILLDLAKKIMPKGQFLYQEAKNLDTTKKYDIVLSHSVFFYFDNLDYAKEVLNKMVKKANKKIAIFDINDKEKESIYYKIRMQTMSKQEYEKKYKNLKHIFFEKDFFVNYAKENNLKIIIWDQNFKKYKNSQYRFNVILTKG